ncbi:MAG: L-serine ammonia-lyase, iron-sulfur-dependent, subunit alpha, partial [Lachnospiraceae bacterium]|nr:L-serine ammonia-lyase, iron-sulfur-dependent, subunit alpha [Lachnospiraceae bacterium]
RVMERAVKMGESNACMKRIVAAPTAGSCGVLPAVLLSLQEEKGYDNDRMTEALYVAAGIGGVIASRAFLAGAAGGCQAEIGSASSMAAGAAAYLNGGDIHAIANAAALAMKNLLGLACDPVAGLVEVPCVKRNVIGAVNALTSADLAIAGVESRIPADEVFDAMRSIGRSLPENIRETGLGGLAGTPTGVKLREKLTAL